MGEIKVIKRNGNIVPFDIDKVSKAIFKAAKTVGGQDFELAKELASEVKDITTQLFQDENPNVEHIKDIVESTLINNGHVKTAKAFILHRHKRDEERRQREFILGKQHSKDHHSFPTQALHILESRYLLKNRDGELIETPAQMLLRVASTISKIDLKYGANEEKIKETEEKFFELMSNLKFLPNSPTFKSAGNGDQLSSCLVLPIKDTLSNIFQTLKEAALTHQRGSGTGFSFSRLRPKGDFVNDLPGVSAGPVDFMQVYDIALESIKQGGVRPGANMAILRVDHPDIIRFVESKRSKEILHNFNISVGITDRFMKAVENDKYYYLMNPRTEKYFGKLRARDVFALITQNAWKTGDPGLIFLDEINKKHPAKHLGLIETTNQCGEAPLLPYESCPLGSLNLTRFVNPKEKTIDWEDLKKSIDIAVHFLDNVIDANNYLTKKIEQQTKATRKFGLGIMGFADCLLKLGLKYDSNEALEFAEKLMSFIKEQAYNSSSKLAKIRGPCPAWEGSEHQKQGRLMRNMTCISIAPTGTLSILAGVSSGCEPLFALAYHRTILGEKEVTYLNKTFEKIAKKREFYSPDLLRKIIRSGSIQNFMEIPKDIRNLFVTAQDIKPEWHIKMQATLQKHVDNSISKTINFPSTASIRDVEEAYILAWKMKCKGITIYRDGSYEEQVITIGQ